MKRQIITGALVALLILSTLASTACTPKTTTQKLAIFTAQADAALIAFTDAVDLLKQAGRIQPDAAKSVYNINLRAAIAVDTLRNRAESGFQKKEALEIIKTILVDVRAAEASGIVGLSGETKVKFQQITFFAIFTLTSIQAVIEATKEPAVPVAVVKAAARPGLAQQGADSTLWTDLVLILQKAVLQGLAQSRLSAVDAFAEGKTLSAQLKDSLTAKIAAL